MPRLIALASTIVLTTLVGCEAQTSDPAPLEAPYAVEFSPAGTPAALLESTTEVERQEMFRRTVEVMASPIGPYEVAAQMLRAAVPVQEKDPYVRELLDAHLGPEWTYLRQTLAHPMLELHLRSETGDIEAIARYASVLVETETPSADLLAQALPLLEEVWTADRRAEAARVAVAASEHWLQRVCVDCTARRATDGAVHADEGMAARALALRGGMATLREASDAR